MELGVPLRALILFGESLALSAAGRSGTIVGLWMGGSSDGRAVGHKFYTPGHHHHHEANNMTMMGNAEGMMEGSRVGVWG